MIESTDLQQMTTMQSIPAAPFDAHAEPSPGSTDRRREETSSAPSSTIRTTPYQGAVPYTEGDSAFFHGRERERDLIVASVEQSWLTVMYGSSGAGKSSLLQAAVVPAFRARSTPKFTVVLFNAWRDDPVIGLTEHVSAAVAEALGNAPAPSRGISLADCLQAATEQLEGHLVIILDQFEDYFLYHPDEDGDGTFAMEFPHAVDCCSPNVHFLISIREEALARLDYFKGRIPDLYDNHLRIDHLDQQAARAAITKPLDQYNEGNSADGEPVSIEPALVTAVLDQVKAGYVALGRAGRGVAAVRAGETRVETPYLQLVMTHLWEEEMRQGSRVLRLETLAHLGGAPHILRTHLDQAMQNLDPKDQDVAARVLRYLVTPAGTKITQSVVDLAKDTGLPAKRVTAVLDKLASGDVHVVRSLPGSPGQPDVPRFEIAHDVLAQLTLDWQQRRAEQQMRERIRQEVQAQTPGRPEPARRRLLQGVVGLAGILVLLSGLIGFAVVQRGGADHQRTIARQEQQTATRAQKAQAKAEQAADGARLLATEAVQQATRQHSFAVSAAMAAAGVPDGIDQEAGAALASGQQALAQGDQRSALDQCMAALNIDSKLARGYFCLGQAYQQLDKNPDALSQYGLAVDTDPSFDPAYLERGLLYANLMQDCAKAAPDLQRYLTSVHPIYDGVARAALQSCARTGS